MKKGVFLILFLIIFFIQRTNAITLTGDAITGKATVMPTNVSIVVIVPIPTIQIISPKDGIYLLNSILLNYSASYARLVSYKIDNGPNITLDSIIYINVLEGSHIIYLFAENNDGVINQTSIAFDVNLTKFYIIYEEYKGAFKGSSTNFTQKTYEELQNLSEVILENSNFGKIAFKSSINLTDDINFSDSILDLDTNTNISFNRIELNPVNLPNFDVPATLWIYGLSFNNPRILKGGSVCLDCNKISYSNGILKFNVTGFSVYSAQETPVSEGGTNRRGGGGGEVYSVQREVDRPISDENAVGFIFDKDKIATSVNSGESKIEWLEIENPSRNEAILNIGSELPDFIKISLDSLTLGPYEKKKISISFDPPKDLLPDIYLGKIFFTSKEYYKEILVSAEVTKGEHVIRVETFIPKSFLKVSPGEYLMTITSIYNTGIDKGKIAEIEYLVMDSFGKTVFIEKGNFTLEEEKKISKTIKLPEDLKSGDYVFYAKVSYAESIQSSSSWFIVKKSFLSPKSIQILLLVLSIIFLIVISVKLKRKNKKR